ncbi:hypothetical protein JTE90_013347 [Oedothorax gibbosus]|uniref:Reverse transcriptase domain-containing protein n=1 Tax=Oedothorax gibbosus TaxID=931172 RepID=A0AAV6TWF9_9ARAC|nr:hypothetical protein JTE90_013347 [Oedothorax gibbosus]
MYHYENITDSPDDIFGCPWPLSPTSTDLVEVAHEFMDYDCFTENFNGDNIVKTSVPLGQYIDPNEHLAVADPSRQNGGGSSSEKHSNNNHLNSIASTNGTCDMAHKFLNIEPFIPGDNPAESWADWRSSYELFETAVKYNKENDETRIALLLSVIGKTSYKDYKTFIFADGQTRTIKDVLDKFDDHYRPYKNTTLSTFVFNNIVQKQGQNFDAFVTELKLQADQCDFGSAYERNVKDRIIQGMRDDVLRERLLREPQLTLARAMEIGKSAELSRMHSLAMAQPTSSQVDAIYHSNRKMPKYQHPKSNQPTSQHQGNYPQNHTSQQRGNYQQNQNKHIQHNSRRLCSRCGRQHQPRQCPAYGKTCNNYSMINHFASVCRQPRQQSSNKQQQHRVSAINTQDVSNIAYIGALSTSNERDWLQQVQVNDYPVVFKLDTGAQVNVLTKTLFECLPSKPILQPTTITVCTYSGDVLPVTGECILSCDVNDQHNQLKFVIVDLDVHPVLSASACVDLQLVQRINPKNCSVNAIASSKLQEVIEEYKDVFEGVGRLPGTHKIIIHDDATPVIAAPRKIPLALEQQVQDELLRMEQNGIIEKVTKPTDWMIRAQTFVPSSHHSEGIGFWPMPFGLSCAPEVFQMAMDTLFENHADINPYFDDIIIHSETLNDHYEKLKTVLEVARQNGLKINKDKLQIAVPELQYLGHIVSSSGLSPDPKKVRAIADFPAPTNKQELMRFLGLIHKPFETISPRLQRLLLRFKKYSFTLVHVPGKQLAVADALSRAPLTANPVITNDIDNTQLMVSVVVQASQSKIAELKQATQNDPEMKAVQQYIQEGWPKDRQSVSVLAKPYWNLQSELHIEDGLICRGQRLVIPRACRKEILQRIHVGHRGIVTCKNLAR